MKIKNIIFEMVKLIVSIICFHSLCVLLAVFTRPSSAAKYFPPQMLKNMFSNFEIVLCYGQIIFSWKQNCINLFFQISSKWRGRRIKKPRISNMPPKKQAKQAKKGGDGTFFQHTIFMKTQRFLI